MKKIIFAGFITAALLGTSISTYAKDSLVDNLGKTATDIGKSINIEKTANKITSTAESVISDAAKSASKTASKTAATLEEQIEKEAKWLAGEGGQQISSAMKKDLPKVIAKLREEVKKTPRDTKLLLKLAIAYKFGGQYSLALTVAEKILTYEPNSKEAALLKAQCYNLQGEAKKGITYLEDFTKEKANSPNLQSYLAALRVKTGNTQKAAEELITEIKANPKAQQLYSKMADIYTVTEAKGIKLFIDGQKLDFSKYGNAQPISKNGSTLVPLRAIVDKLGADINYDPASSKINITTAGKKIVIEENKNIATVNSKSVKLSQSAIVVNGKTYVPLRFVSEQLNKSINWYPYSNYGIITINSK